MSAKRKKSSNVVSRQKYNRHRLLSFFRMIRYGVDSFLRNSWLSVAATAVMVITLLIIFGTFIIQNTLNDTLIDLQEKVDMSIYLKTETTDEVGSQLSKEINKLSSVKSVEFISADKAREQIIQESKNDIDMISAIKEASNKNPASLRVVIEDINDTSELEKFVKENDLLKENLNPSYKPSFEGDRREAIKSIGRMVDFARNIGVIAGSIFVGISSLIIFNTIRMAIFNRREEIQMMKLIGASRSFIRGPFLVEAMIYGIIAGLIATGLGVFGLSRVSEPLTAYQINVQPTMSLINNYIVLVVFSMTLAGAFIGVVSSSLATYRYLKD